MNDNRARLRVKASFRRKQSEEPASTERMGKPSPWKALVLEADNLCLASSSDQLCEHGQVTKIHRAPFFWKHYFLLIIR